MPTLGLLNCQLEWGVGGTREAFKEYAPKYGDAWVETYVAIPDEPQPFCMRFQSTGYIAEGLAIIVYIDGVYQCNRNRIGLKPEKRGRHTDKSTVFFRTCQSETKTAEGEFKANRWRFDKHNIGEST